jgi:hypothetical protein
MSGFKGLATPSFSQLVKPDKHNQIITLFSQDHSMPWLFYAQGV